jgi:hypothetical protein
MDTPLQFLRNWLPSGGQTEHMRAADSLREWISTLDDAPPQDIAAALSSRLMPLVSEQRNLHMRTRLLDAFEEAAHKVLPALEDEIRHAAVPLTPHVQALALTADNLLKSQIQGYLSIISSIEDRKQGTMPAPLLQHVILRAMYALQRRQMLAYRAYAAPSAASWQHLHDLHRVARDRGLSKISKNSPSIEHVYIAALLLAYAEPGKFPRSDLDTLRACADRMSALVRLSDTKEAPRTEAPSHLFLVHTDDGQPGAPFLRTPKASDARQCLIVDCGAVVAALNEDISQRTHPVFEHEAMLPQVAEPILKMLLQMWGSQPTRRFSRMRFKPRADVVSGLPDVIQMIDGEALRRRRNDGSSQQEPLPPPISEWAIINESPDGFGIRYLKGPIRRLEVGELVGLRSHEHNRIHLCLVRRAINSGQARFEIGLQGLSPHGLIVTLPDSANSQLRQALLLPQLPAYGGSAGIIGLPGSLPAGIEFTCQPAGKPVRLRLGRPVDLNTRLEFYLLEEVN